jgi:hypothetical protein
MFKKSVLSKTFLILALFITGAMVASARPTSAFHGASFNEVWKVVTVNPTTVTEDMENDIRSYGTPNNPTLPSYSGLLSAIGSLFGALGNAANLTIQNHDDYHHYFEKLVHSNGTCFAGAWEMTEDSKYSGFFQKGSSGLIIGRISVAGPTPTNDSSRAFGFAGKIFPTTNPDEVVQTANFFTVDNLNGTKAKHALDVAFINEPPVDLSGGILNPLNLVNRIFEGADIHPTMRPVYPISDAGRIPGTPKITPKWLRIRVAKGIKLPNANDSDFRNELSARNYPNGLIFTVDVSDTTKDAYSDSGWQKVGQIRTSALVTTFGCDRRLHFPHPTFNDPNK